MTCDVRTVTPDTTIIAVADLFVRSALRRLPVMEDGNLVGQVSRRDILRAIRSLSAEKLMDMSETGRMAQEAEDIRGMALGPDANRRFHI